MRRSLNSRRRWPNKTVEASSGGGMVNIVMNGKQEILSIRIDPEVVNREDVEMLQD